MALRDETPKVGVYIDFENLHATFADAEFGDGSYRENRMSVQPMFFDIVPILHYAASLSLVQRGVSVVIGPLPQIAPKKHCVPPPVPSSWQSGRRRR